tara:strand:- start:39 stop:473 length:435 start_codon:yes stop_codon:yes gene_type:complete
MSANKNNFEITDDSEANQKSGVLLDSKNLFGYKRLNHARYSDIITLNDMRFGANGADDGFRDLFLWTACNYFALANSRVSKIDMWQEFYQIAKHIAPEWSFSKIRSALSTIYQKHKDTLEGKTVSFGGRDYSPMYTHKNSNLGY